MYEILLYKELNKISEAYKEVQNLFEKSNLGVFRGFRRAFVKVVDGSMIRSAMSEYNFQQAGKIEKGLQIKKNVRAVGNH